MGNIRNIGNLVIVACCLLLIACYLLLVAFSKLSKLSKFPKLSKFSFLCSFVFRLSSLVFNPACAGFSSLRLGIVCKHPLLSLRCVGSSLVFRLSSSLLALFLPYLRAKGVVGKKVIFFLSLICLHIFLLFSVCTHRPSFLLPRFAQK